MDVYNQQAFYIGIAVGTVVGRGGDVVILHVRVWVKMINPKWEHIGGINLRQKSQLRKFNSL